MRKKTAHPCKDCPFRTDSPFARAGLPRAPEIARQLSDDRGDFQCHKTTHETGTGKPQGCAGAYKVILQEGRMNQLMRISARLGLFDPEACEASPIPVYATLEEWARAMTRGYSRSRKPRRKIRP